MNSGWNAIRESCFIQKYFINAYVLMPNKFSHELSFVLDNDSQNSINYWLLIPVKGL